ncbi:MAG: hypothetical protein P1Q69_20810, partial [Candidatus Thorarchaeota archaeon]|nr:hypothetical protein [Candidatus Thorarchaeota archaeon]
MNRSGIFGILLLCGFAIFVTPIFFVEPFKSIYMIATTILFLLVYLWARSKENLKEYLHIILAFFIASLVFFLQIYWISGATVEEIVFNKIVGTLIVVIPIILIVKVTKGEMSEIYLKRG